MCKNFLKETKNPHYGGANDMRLLKLLCQKHGQWTCDEIFFFKYNKQFADLANKLWGI